MRLFKIEALVEERSLWDIMQVLERARARGIMARPYFPEEKQQKQQLTVPSLVPQDRNFKTGGKAAEIRAVVFAILAETGEPVTAEMVKNKTSDKFTIKQVAQTFMQLRRHGHVKRVGHGRYVRSDSPIEAKPNGGGSQRDRVRAAIVAALAAGGSVVPKDILASTGLSGGAVYGTIHQLFKDGYLKRTGDGIYTKGRKELT